MKKAFVRVLAVSILFSIFIPLVSIGEGQPSIDDLAAFFSYEETEPSDNDKRLDKSISLFSLLQAP